MIKVIASLMAAGLFFGCSSTPKPNSWEYKSASAFRTYKQDTLKGRTSSAKNDLKRAIAYAKMGADFTQLGSIYLGECALALALEKSKMPCKDYEEIAPLVQQGELHTYNRFLKKEFALVDTKKLDKQYVEFAIAMQKNNTNDANKAILTIKSPTSVLVAIALLGASNTNKQTIEYGLEKLSFYGYKEGIIQLLKIYKTKLPDDKKAEIEKKIAILKK